MIHVLGVTFVILIYAAIVIGLAEAIEAGER